MSATVSVLRRGQVLLPTARPALALKNVSGATHDNSKSGIEAENLWASRAVDVITRSGARFALAQTAGAHVLPWLLEKPGISRHFLESRIVYARGAMEEFVGGRLVSHCSPRTSRELACAAYIRALDLAPPEAFTDSAPLIGVACTAALLSTTAKKGPHRIHIATWDRHNVCSWSVTLVKGARDRRGEERVASGLMLAALRHAASGHAEDHVWNSPRERVPSLLIEEGVEFSTRPNWMNAVVSGVAASPGMPSWVPVRTEPFSLRGLSGTTTGCEEMGPMEARSQFRPGQIIVSGSFNPVHMGHLQLARAAAGRVKAPRVFFELSVRNADKAPVSEREVRRRLAHFFRIHHAGEAAIQGGAADPTAVRIHGEPMPPQMCEWVARHVDGVLVSSEGHFINKAKLFPNSIFAVGFDTAVRLTNPHYYGDSRDGMLEAMREIAKLGCSFIVGGRVDMGKDGLPLAGARFHSFDEVKTSLPEDVAALFSSLTEEEFRLDLSSTFLRSRL